MPEQFLELPRAVLVGVFGQHSPARRRADAPGAIGVEVFQVLDHLLAARREQYLFTGFKKFIHAFPLVHTQAGSRAGRFEHPRRGRKAVAGHAVAVNAL